jgi:hypothetical protein
MCQHLYLTCVEIRFCCKLQQFCCSYYSSFMSFIHVMHAFILSKQVSCKTLNFKFKLYQEQLFLTGKMKHLRTTSAWFICKYPLYLRTNEVKIHRFFYAGLYYSVLVRKQKTLKIVCFYHELIQTQFWIQTCPRQSDVHVDKNVVKVIPP